MLKMGAHLICLAPTVLERRGVLEILKIFWERNADAVSDAVFLQISRYSDRLVFSGTKWRDD